MRAAGSRQRRDDRQLVQDHEQLRRAMPQLESGSGLGEVDF